MNMWKIGQEIVCVDTSSAVVNSPIKSHSPALVKHEIYKIRDITECVHCKRILLDVGLPNETEYDFTRCVCDNIINSPNSHLCSSHRFRPLDEVLEEITIEKSKPKIITEGGEKMFYNSMLIIRFTRPNI